MNSRFFVSDDAAAELARGSHGLLRRDICCSVFAAAEVLVAPGSISDIAISQADVGHILSHETPSPTDVLMDVKDVQDAETVLTVLFPEIVETEGTQVPVAAKVVQVDGSCVTNDVVTNDVVTNDVVVDGVVVDGNGIVSDGIVTDGIVTDGGIVDVGHGTIKLAPGDEAREKEEMQAQRDSHRWDEGVAERKESLKPVAPEAAAEPTTWWGKCWAFLKLVQSDVKSKDFSFL